MTPGSGAYLLRSWEFVAGLSQLLGRKKAPAMTGSFTPQEKTSPSAKTQRCEVGAWQPAAVREEPLGQSVFLQRQCGKAGQPEPACNPAPLLPRGLRQGLRRALWGWGGLGNTWRRQEAPGTLCSSEDCLRMSTAQGVRRHIQPRSPDF